MGLSTRYGNTWDSTAPTPHGDASQSGFSQLSGGDPNHNVPSTSDVAVPLVCQMLSDSPYSISRVHPGRVGGSVAKSM